MLKLRHVTVAIFVLALSFIGIGAPARAADPVKVGFSMALTGSVAQNGKQLIIALELWRDDVNAHGGLLGRPVELIYYDDQSNPANVPGIYTKLITVDKVDLLLGPYATNMAAAGDAGHHAAQHDDDQHSCSRCEPAFSLFALLRHDSGRTGRDQGVLAWLLRARRGAETEAADGCDRRRRRRVLRKPPPMAHGRTPRPRVSRSSMIKAIRRARPISRR